MIDQNPPSHATDSQPPDTKLVRGLGLPQSIALNISNMVGIGPFVTIPLFIAAMNGPQALIAWIIAAVLVICDGLVWSELGAALPGSGGTYHFLREIFGRHRSPWARLLPFLFVWQFFRTFLQEYVREVFRIFGKFGRFRAYGCCHPIPHEKPFLLMWLIVSERGVLPQIR